MKDKRILLSLLSVLAMILLLAASLTAILASLELGIMTPLHIIGGLALWRRKTWGYLAATVLAFTAFMVFIALCVSLLLFYVSFGRGDVLDMAITTAIAVVATGFSFVIFKRAQD